MRGPVTWWKDPWRKPHILKAATWLYLLWSLIPVLIAVMFSFNNGRSRSSWQGFSTMWYVGTNLPGGAYSVFANPVLRMALTQTLKLAVITTCIAVPLGLAFALGIDRWHGRGSGTSNFAMLFSFVMPELVIGVALFFVFGQALKMVPPGTWQQALGLITFQISYPVIIIRARLLSIGRQYEEAAMDLGAKPTQSLRRVLLPLLYPAIFASAVLVFADCIDDFVIVRALGGPSSSETISMKLYSGYRSAPTPAYNALATIMLVGTLSVMFIGLIFFGRSARKEGKKGDAVESFAVSI
jgi:spermidine/putrescine transport system permease protein